MSLQLYHSGPGSLLVPDSKWFGSRSNTSCVIDHIVHGYKHNQYSSCCGYLKVFSLVLFALLFGLKSFPVLQCKVKDFMASVFFILLKKKTKLVREHLDDTVHWCNLTLKINKWINERFFQPCNVAFKENVSYNWNWNVLSSIGLTNSGQK